MEESKKLEVLKQMNTLMGFGIVNLNVTYDDEDAEMFDKIITSKLSDLPNVMHKLFTGLLEDTPEEMKNMTVLELMNEITPFDLEG